MISGVSLCKLKKRITEVKVVKILILCGLRAKLVFRIRVQWQDINGAVDQKREIYRKR